MRNMYAILMFLQFWSFWINCFGL